MQTVVWCASLVFVTLEAVRNESAAADGANDAIPASVRAIRPLSLIKLPMALNAVISMRNAPNRITNLSSPKYCDHYH